MIGRIARIESTSLGFEDHGILTAWLHVTYGGSSQGIGGFALTHSAGSFIRGVLRACGVDKWEKLVGRTIYVLREDTSFQARAVGIEPLPTEDGERFLFDEWQRSQERLAAARAEVGHGG